MSGGFQVSTDELRTHAASVSAVAGDVEQAASAAGTERAGGLVYGVLFDAIALEPLNIWADHIQSLAAKNVELGKKIASGIAHNAETYDGVEDHTVKHITTSGQGH